MGGKKRERASSEIFFTYGRILYQSGTNMCGNFTRVVQTKYELEELEELDTASIVITD